MEMEKPRLESSRGLSAQDEIKYRRKYKELKKRIREIEEENDNLTVKLHRARKNIQRLRIERNFLFERLEQTSVGDNGPGTDSSELSSDDVSHDSDLSDPPLDEHDRPLAGSSSSSSHRHHHSKGSGRGSLLFDKSAAPRRKKDPNAPKRPGNVFFLYCRLEREKIKDEHPGENLGDLTKLLGQKWKSLTKDEKQKYYDAYKKEQEDYQNAMKTYTPPASGDKSRQHQQHHHQLQFAPPHQGMGGPMGGPPPHMQPPSFSSAFAPPQSSMSPLPPPLRQAYPGPGSGLPLGPPTAYHPPGFVPPVQHHQLPPPTTAESTPAATPSRSGNGVPRPGGSEMDSNVGDELMDEELDDEDDEAGNDMEDDDEEELDELEETNGADEEEEDYKARGNNGRNGRREEHREEMPDI